MKRMMIAAMLLLGYVSVFASEGKGEERVEIGKKTELVQEIPCTVSVTGSVRVVGLSLQVNCSATSEKGCKEASIEAKNCVREIKKEIESMF
jgi:hypothetical protein